MVASVAAELPVYVSEVPDCEPRGDCIRVVWRGREAFIPVPVAAAYVGRLNRSLDKWHEDRGIVRPFRGQPTLTAVE